MQVSRAEEEKRLAQKKKEEEERRVREIEEKKQRDIEEKRQRLEEAEKKRQAMLQAMKESSKTGPNFTIQKKSDNVSNTTLAVLISRVISLPITTLRMIYISVF